MNPVNVTFSGGSFTQRLVAAPAWGPLVVGTEPREVVRRLLGEFAERRQSLPLEHLADGVDDHPVQVEALAGLLAELLVASHALQVHAVGHRADGRLDRVGLEDALRVLARAEHEVCLRVEPPEVRFEQRATLVDPRNDSAKSSFVTWAWSTSGMSLRFACRATATLPGPTRLQWATSYFAK